MDDEPELENADESLNVGMGLAFHWGVLRIPDSKQVVITGFTITLDQVNEHGVVMVMDRQPDSPAMSITDNKFLSCTLTGLLDFLIDTAHTALADEVV